MPTTAQGLRYPAGTDSPDIPRDVTNLAADVDLRIPPIGSVISWDGTGDPPGGVWLLADGRLIDRTVYAAYYSVVGHAFNGGVDPGGTPAKVRIQDRRGRVGVGADSMGTAVGAAGRLPNSNRVRGQNGGSDARTLNHDELPFGNLLEGTVGGANQVGWSLAGTGPDTIKTNHAGIAHSIMQPYEVGNKIVRVA